MTTDSLPYMPDPRPETIEEGRVYIGELKPIVNREMNTIRKWERLGHLPKHLHSKRGWRGWRYWTDKQVWGANGIVAWMEKNDVRPGKLVASPDKVDEHLSNLHKPKYLDGYHLKSAKAFADKGRSREWIVRKLYPRTKYSRPENLEAALEREFERRGWYFPPSIGRLRMLPDRVEREVAAIEREAKDLERRMVNRDNAVRIRRKVRIRSRIRT